MRYGTAHYYILQKKKLGLGPGKQLERARREGGGRLEEEEECVERETETARKERQEERAGNRDLDGCDRGRAWKSQTDILGKEGD